MLKVQEMLKNKKDVRLGDWNAKEVEVINTLTLLTAKPVVYLVNMSEADYISKKNRWYVLICVAQSGNHLLVSQCLSLGLVRSSSGSMRATLTRLCLSAPTLRRISLISIALLQLLCVRRRAARPPSPSSSEPVRPPTCIRLLLTLLVAGYHALELGHYFTAGADEVRAWTVRVGTKAPQAAGIIHTDFEKVLPPPTSVAASSDVPLCVSAELQGFICAETMKFVDFKECGSEAACKAAGKYIQKGREYVVCDGDILFFKVRHILIALLLFLAGFVPGP